jgi:HPt (histidine-containing phosphotransfer) domain-containing protein
MDGEQAEVLDRTALMERLEGDLELFHEITGLFREDCPKLLTEIRSAVTDANAPALERAAHTLKGCVANFGAEAAFRAALQLERMGRARELEGAGSACETLETEVLRFQQALEALARELSQP